MSIGFKHIAIVLALAAMLPTLFRTAAAEAKTEAPADLRQSWASKTLLEWWNKEWIRGYSDGSFRPDSNISRAEFISLANRMFGLSGKADIAFRDLRERSWAHEPIATAVRAGYVKGYKDGTIRPNADVSREEAAHMLYVLLKLDPGRRDVPRFTDAPGFAKWSKPAIEALAAEGILAGYPDGTFRPERKMTRAEAVVALDKAMLRSPRSNEPSEPEEPSASAQDRTPPEFAVPYPLAYAVTESIAAVAAKTNEAGKLYAVAVLPWEAFPDAVQVKTGRNGAGSPAVSFGQIALSEKDETVLLLAGLTAGTDYSIYVVAEDAHGNFQAVPSKVNVKTSGTAPLAFVTTSLPKAQVGNPFSLTIQTSGGTGARTYSLAAGALPPGTAFSSSGYFTGTPTVSGSYAFTLRVTDALSVSTDQNFTLVVDPPVPPQFITTSLPKAQAGVPYSLTVQTSGGSGSLSFALAAGALPPGVAFSSKGYFTGTPTVAGSYALTLRVTDALSVSADQSFTLVVDP